MEKKQKEAVARQKEAKAEEKKKKEEEAKKKKGGEKYPGDPDNSNDSFQQKLMENMLTKILKTEASSIHDQGPVIRIQTEGPSGRPRWVFVFNPFYKGPDPMKEIIWETKNADGTRGYVRNPFAPGVDTSKQQELRKLIESDGVIGPSVFYRW